MNDIAVLIGLISFPGLIATILCDKLLVHAERWTSFKYGIYTFVFGVGSYVVLQVVVYAAHVLDRHLPWLSNKRELALWATLTSRESLSFAEVGWATFIAPFVALSAVAMVNKKIINGAGRLLNLSNKYGDENLFSYYLNAQNIWWVYIRDPSNGLSYRGAIKSFSETKEIQEIVMTDVTVYSYPDSDELYRLESIYLSKPVGVFIIEAAAPIAGNPGEGNDGKKDPVSRRVRTRSSERRRDTNNV